MGALTDLFEKEMAKRATVSQGRPLSDRDFDARCVKAIERAAAEVHTAGVAGGPAISRIRELVKQLDFIAQQRAAPVKQQQILGELEAALGHPDLLTAKLTQPKPSIYDGANDWGRSIPGGKAGR
jgi:hypothetical protein